MVSHRPTTIPPKHIPNKKKGEGRIDYSMSIAHSVSKTTIDQTQIGIVLTAVLPTMPYPFTYSSVIAGDLFIDGASVAIPSGYSLWIYNADVSGDTNGISALGIQIYNNYDVATNTLSDLFETVELKFGTKIADLRWSQGFDISKYAGKYLAVLFTHYSVNPTINLDVTLHALVDRPLIGEQP